MSTMPGRSSRSRVCRCSKTTMPMPWRRGSLPANASCIPTPFSSSPRIGCASKAEGSASCRRANIIRAPATQPLSTPCATLHARRSATILDRVRQGSWRESLHVHLNPLRVGVVGTAAGSAVHIPGLRQVPLVEVAAVAGIDGSSAASVAARYQIPAYFDDYRLMFRRAGINAVTIAVPAEFHHSGVIAAVEHGLHILCDAPMARSAAEARDM